MSAQGSNLFGGKPSPDSPLLPGFDRVGGAEVTDRALSAEFLSRSFGFDAELRLWEIFREEDLWEPLAGDFPGGVDRYKQFAMWMATIKHAL